MCPVLVLAAQGHTEIYHESNISIFPGSVPGREVYAAQSECRLF